MSQNQNSSAATTTTTSTLAMSSSATTVSGSSSAGEKQVLREIGVSNSQSGTVNAINHNGPGKKKKKQMCLNEECKQEYDLESAPSYAVLYFGQIPIGSVNDDLDKSYLSTPKNLKVCKSCKLKADNFILDSEKQFIEGKSVFTVPIIKYDPTRVVIDVDDDEENSDDNKSELEIADDAPEEMVSFTDNLDEVIKDIVEKFHLPSQLQMEKKILQKEMDDLDQLFKGIESSFSQTEDEFEAVRKSYSSLCAPKYEMVITKSIDINESGEARVVDNYPSSSNTQVIRKKTHGEIKSMPAKIVNKNIKNDLPEGSEWSAFNSQVEIKKVDEMEFQKSIDPNEEIQEVNTVKTIRPKINLAATPQVIPRVPCKVCDVVYAMKTNALSFWVKATVIEVLTGPFGKNEYKVQYDGQKKNRLGNLQTASIQKILSPNHLAYNLPCPFVLPVGTRIIGKFKDEFGVAPAGDGNYYAGIVAEPPKHTNRFRYLVFFDDGYAQYVSQDQVLLVCEASKEVWKDIHPDSQDFIQNYVLKYPERPMVRLQKGTVVTTEWNGKWWVARVAEVDCSLVKMHFEADNRFEWIYRGSTRLSPLYNQQKRQDQLLNKRRPQPQRASNKNHTIEYLYGEEDFPDTDNKSKPTARKSTTPSGSTSNFSVQPPPIKVQYNTVQVPTKKPVPKINNLSTFLSLIEYEGKMGRKSLPNDLPVAKVYEPHQCSPKCVFDFDAEHSELNRLSPLSLPFYLGFSREIAKNPKRTVFYRTPCGKRIRDYNDMHRFIRETDYNVGMDHFCFDYSVDCLSEFCPTRNLYCIKDLSYGKEIVPVTCVNSLDYDYPEYMEYSRERLPGKNVHLNLDDDFLTCCDCTDDCLDKSKCACWKMTIETTGIINGGKVNQNAGYQNRKLFEHVVTGIYECNNKCKCKFSTCTNRVAQNRLKWPLQIFKTSTKGWGIRPLYDIPVGAFVCVYAGQLLTEQGANEDGTQYGDEYLAELDYIEVIESIKDGYEDDIVEPSDDEDNSRKIWNGRYDRKKNDSDADNSNKRKRKDDDDDDNSDGEDEGSQRRPTRNFDASFSNDSKKLKGKEMLKTRELFGLNEQCYIMDAKGIGNIGRYLNHSCKPNVFVQNVFVDTHDLRFPWVSFFASTHIKAGTELTWDYNYEIGSVPGKKMYCFCGAPECRGRLL